MGIILMRIGYMVRAPTEEKLNRPDTFQAAVNQNGGFSHFKTNRHAAGGIAVKAPQIKLLCARGRYSAKRLP